MSELEDILNHLETTSLEPHDDYTDEFSYKDQKILWKYIKDLQQENQKLKSTLNLYKGSLHREHEAIHRANDLEEENQELKNQQKEFIEYLEDKLNMCDGFLDTIKSDLKEISYAGRISGKNYIATQIMKNETAKKNYEDILSKYKEIIGGDNK